MNLLCKNQESGNLKERLHCVTGAVLTHDVMYPKFNFFKPPMSALCTNPQSPQNIYHPLFELYTTPEGGNI